MLRCGELHDASQGSLDPYVAQNRQSHHTGLHSSAGTPACPPKNASYPPQSQFFLLAVLWGNPTPVRSTVNPPPSRRRMAEQTTLSLD